MDLLNIGDFDVDVKEKRIYNSEGELPVEPKVIDVLCYLIQHSSRYVSLQELHTEVWAGRVVTDTAVRRTISKLRTLLGDTEPESPRYIRSQMKRGYQFIYQPEPGRTVESGQSLSNETSVSPVSSLEKPSETSIAPSRHFIRSKYVTAVSLLLLTVLALVVLTNSISEKIVVNSKPLVDIAGEKRFLSVSEDGRFHTFTGRLNQSGPWQPYLYDFKLGQLQRISVPNEAAYHIVSMLNNDVVAISSQENGVAKLYLYSALNLNLPTKPLLLEEFSDIGQAVSYKDNIILINGKKKQEINGLYYFFDLEKRSLEQFTYSSKQGSVDFGAVLSPDKKHLALIRRDSVYHIQIYRIADKKLLIEESFSQNALGADELNLMWINQEELLVNYGHKLKQLNIETGASALLPLSERFTGFGRDLSGNMFGLLLKPQGKAFYQIQLPDLDTVQRYFSFEEQVVSLTYSDEVGRLWLVEENKDSFSLYSFFPATGEKKLILQSKEVFTLIAEEPDYVLLLQKNQLRLLELQSGELSNISYENQQVWTAATTPDKLKVIFTEKIGDEWLVNLFDRQTSSQSRILKGYRLLLPWRESYIAADPKGQFYLLDLDFHLVKSLPLKVNFELRHQVNLLGDKLVSANLKTDSNWSLITLELLTGNSESQFSTSLPIKSSFSFNNDGTRSIVTIENEHINQLVKIGYNFSYN